MFGRTIEIDEQPVAGEWVATRYTYACNDTISTITDPNSNVTTLIHDFAGRRIETRREAKSWSYAYDKNGNIRSELVPGWTSIIDQPNFLTTTAYDDLDRPISRSIGQRRLSAFDQVLFATGTETYTWDYGSNHQGYLRYWGSYAPNSSTQSILLDIGNNIQGQRTLINQTLNIAGYPQLSRQFLQSYYLSGALRGTSYRDYVGLSVGFSGWQIRADRVVDAPAVA